MSFGDPVITRMLPFFIYTRCVNSSFSIIERLKRTLFEVLL